MVAHMGDRLAELRRRDAAAPSSLPAPCCLSCREDPELKPVFEEMKSGGMAAVMKYMNDPAFLAVRAT